MKRITLKPTAIPATSTTFFPVLETWCDGVLCSRVVGKELFASRGTAAMFAETRALGAVGELIHHYGDSFTFSVQAPPASPRASHYATATDPLPTCLTRAYRELVR